MSTRANAQINRPIQNDNNNNEDKKRLNKYLFNNKDGVMGVARGHVQVSDIIIL